MTIYRYSDPSALTEVTYHHNEGYPPVALLKAADNVSDEKLFEIRSTIEVQGWQCVPVTIDGQDLLQVGGFKEEGKCNALLFNRHFISGTREIIAEAAKPAKKISPWKKFMQQYSLPIAGGLNLFGDVSLFKNGLKTKDPYMIAGGSLYTLGGANWAFLGTVKPGEGAREVTESTAEIIKRQTGSLPQGSGLSNIYAHRRKSGFSKALHFLHEHTGQTTLYAYTVGAGAMLGSGIRQYRAGDGASGIRYSVWSLATKTGALVVREKDEVAKGDKHAHKRKNALERLGDWVQEKPLRIFGYGSAISEVLLGWNAYEGFKRNPEKSGYGFKAVAAGAYFLSDIFAAQANKETSNAAGKFDKEEQRAIEALDAEAIAHAPKEAQDGLIRRVSEFLATQPQMEGNATLIDLSIRQQVEHMPHNRWAHRVETNSAEPTAQFIR